LCHSLLLLFLTQLLLFTIIPRKDAKEASEVSEDAKPAYSVGQGIFASEDSEAKYILRESALHFELSIQSPSAKICSICGRKTSLLSTQRGKGSKGAKIASAKICVICGRKNFASFHASERSEDAKEAKAQKLHLRKSVQSAGDKTSLQAF
jgi:hypothetical protein